MYAERSPRLIGFQVAPPSSVRNAPAAEIAITICFGFFGLMITMCRHMPPAPGAHAEPVVCVRSPASSVQFCPPSVEWNMAASSTPAYTSSGFVSDGSKCHTRLNSHGCGVPSYHWCVPGTPSYRNLLPTTVHVLPLSSDRCTTCPDHDDDCDA